MDAPTPRPTPRPTGRPTHPAADASEAPSIDPRDALARLRALRERIADLPRHDPATLASLPARAQPSATNLLHYLALRREDTRELQHELSALGLSSLGRSERHTLANVDAVLHALEALARHPPPPSPPPPSSSSASPAPRGSDPLHERADALLGPAPEGRPTRIMVTLPSEAATDPAIALALAHAGMDLARINAAHDHPDAWARMIQHVRDAAAAVGRTIRILMDIEGPKARTGPIEPGPKVARWNPPRDPVGQLLRLASIRLTDLPPTTTLGPRPSPEPRHDAHLTVPAAFLQGLAPGDTIHFNDARGFGRRLVVQSIADHEAIASCDRSAFVVPGLALRRPPAPDRPGVRGEIGDLPAMPQGITLRPGEEFWLAPDTKPGQPEHRDASGAVLVRGRIAFTLPQALADIRPGHRVMLDDGKVRGVAVRIAQAGDGEADPGDVLVRVERCRAEGVRIIPDKGVNLPDSTLRVAPLSPDDLSHLPFIAQHADIIGMSFVSTPEEVRDLQERLAALGGSRVGIVLKIETRRAFENLPDLLLAALRTPGGAGVMIARGDLAVELGYERLAEVQEEVLWLCEAAHLPVIWATQVLESLAKKGLPSRSEITDAAMGQRAECVMLNKGPYAADAVRVLDDILRRMNAHQSKKRSMLRPLAVAQRFGRRATPETDPR